MPDKPKEEPASPATPSLQLPSRIRSTQDWITYITANPGITLDDVRDIRCNCYKAIEAQRKRPLLVYASKFLQLSNSTVQIDLSDIEGFTDLANSVVADSVDVLIHSPGGDPNATERIVDILRNRFKKEVHFLVPHSAYSAATMLALSGNTITVHPSATLGPIDPQINGIPGRSIKRGFENAKEKIRLEGADVLPAYIPLIEKYPLHLLEICDDAEKLSKELVTEWLTKYMFAGAEQKDKIATIVEYFSKYDTHLTHSRALHFNKLQHLNLNLVLATPPLDELLWEAFILLNVFFQGTQMYKVIENSDTISWGRQNMVQPQQKSQVPTIGIE